MQTHLFISPAKFAKILLNYPNYFFISDTHKILKYNIYIYIYIYIYLGRCWHRNRCRLKFLYEIIQAMQPQHPRVE